MIRYPQTTASATPTIQAALRAGVEFSMLQQADELNRLLNWAYDTLPGYPAVVVEIGSHQGGSAAAFCTVATDLMLSIDLPDGVGGGRTVEQLRERDARLQARWPHYRSIYGDSTAAITQSLLTAVLAGRPIDLLFIDGDHTYAGVSADYAAYACYVRPGGIIAFHDIVESAKSRASGFEVARFWQALPATTKLEFLAPDTHQPDWGGIGAVVVA